MLGGVIVAPLKGVIFYFFFRMSLFPTQDIEKQQERRPSLGGALLSGLGTGKETLERNLILGGVLLSELGTGKLRH